MKVSNNSKETNYYMNLEMVIGTGFYFIALVSIGRVVS